MRRIVSLSLTGSHVVPHGSPEGRISVENNDWHAALSQALAAGQADSQRQRLDVRAELGADHARVALMTVNQDRGLASVSPAKHEAFVRAWAADMLHVAPDDQVIRWRVLGDPRKVLVSCVSRAVAEQLERACGETGARLVSCRPALLGALDAVERLKGDAEPRELTVIWTEDGASNTRHAVVQLLRFSSQRLAAAWRGWVPAADEPTEEAVHAVVAQFDSQGDGPAATLAKLHWPAQAT